MLWKKLVPQLGDCQVSVKRKTIENKNSQFPGRCTYVDNKNKDDIHRFLVCVFYTEKCIDVCTFFFLFLGAYNRDISPNVEFNRCRSSVKRRC